MIARPVAAAGVEPGRAERLPAAMLYCERCDKYHAAQLERHRLLVRWQTILRYLALGYRDAEIAPLVGLSTKGVEYGIASMMRRYYALSRPNLVAIALALGILNPNDFVADTATPRKVSRAGSR